MSSQPRREASTKGEAGHHASGFKLLHMRVLLQWREGANPVGLWKLVGVLVMIRILMADDHDVVRSGLRHIVEAQPNWQVVAEAADGKEAVQKALETKPDVAVIDYSLPLINGVEATRQIRSAQPRTEVLIFTMHDNETLIQELLKAGARGYLLKTDARRHLIGAIEALAAHKPFFTAKVSEALLDYFLSRPAREGSALTHRERGVVQLVAEGYTNKQIANLLDISLKTVETHRAAIMRKLKLSSPAALVRYAIRNQIVEP
jgi:DNA-binding NarL/FixJ family response regulator